jgi:biopolymer transport protein TolQ
LSQLICFSLALIQTSSTDDSSLSGLLLKASPIAKGVLVLLLILSLVSWTIIFSKWRWLKRAEGATADFLGRFRKDRKLSDLYMDSDACKASPVALVFVAGYEELGNQMSGNGRQIYSMDAIGRILQSATIKEVTAMEKSLSWLATTANASPFIGLFGTVVGIIIAFQGLSSSNSSSIQAVAPGIAEALIATAAGIATAVPAAIFYNMFLSRVKSLTASIDRFSLDLMNLVERHYFKADV